MVKVSFLGPIGLNDMEINAQNLTEVKNHLQNIKELEQWLPISAIAINDKMIDSLEHKLEDGDNITLLPPVCGG